MTGYNHTMDCPRCSGLMLKDEDGLACTMCGARQYAMPVMAPDEANREVSTTRNVAKHRGVRERVQA